MALSCTRSVVDGVLLNHGIDESQPHYFCDRRVDMGKEEAADEALGKVRSDLVLSCEE